MNFKNINKKLAPHRFLQKKDRIFSAVTGKTNKIKTFGTHEPTSDAQEDSAYVANYTNEPWLGGADSNINKSYSRKNVNNKIFGGINHSRIRHLNRESNHKRNSRSPGSPALLTS